MNKQLSCLPPELSPTYDSPDEGSWVGVLLDIATEEGYRFPPGMVGRYCKEWFDRYGIEALRSAWRTWLKEGPVLGEQAGYMNPKAFADKFGYWLKLSEPARR